jgi:hypothetical protein
VLGGSPLERISIDRNRIAIPTDRDLVYGVSPAPQAAVP